MVRLRILGESIVEVGGGCITPDSPQLFALALYFGCSEGRPVHKSELLELFFPDPADESRASHKLRQLLYRLRHVGVPIGTRIDQLRLPTVRVTSTLDEFARMTCEQRVQISPYALSVLPSFEPRISRQMTRWIETLRSRAHSRLGAILRDDLRTFEQKCDWDHVVTSGRSLQELQGWSDDTVSSVAQALLMRGRKQEALDILDSFFEECDPASLAPLRRLRGRIARTEGGHRVLKSTFHGRRDIMGELLAQWQLTREFVPQLAILTGPAGIGKTRLAHEFSGGVRVQGGHCLCYRCDQSDSARPYAVFRALLPNLRAMRGSLGASPELQSYLDLVASSMTAAVPLEADISALTRNNIQRALVDLLEAVSVEKRLLIVVDDAQLQDAASRSVCKSLVSDGAQAGVMIVWCNRSITSHDVDTNYALRAQVHQLTPLSEQDSLSVLEELLPDCGLDRETLRGWSRRAGGNPYYLYAMAYEHGGSDQDPTSAFDIRRFAASSYLGLSESARTLFEACILLGPLASVQRVRKIADVEGPRLISALRELESSGMVCYDGGSLRCAHALLEEASLGLIPKSVTAFLHDRIGSELERECSATSYPAALTWAAAEHWIAIGDVAMAAVLLRRCASQAAALGEPLIAAQALLHIPIASLNLNERSLILTQLVEYCEVGGDFRGVLDALRVLRTTRIALGCSDQSLREIDLRITEAHLHQGANPMQSTPALEALVNGRDVPVPVRLRAGGYLLIAADMHLDERLASATYMALQPELGECSVDSETWQRAELVYHTVFGARDRALEVAEMLLSRYPRPEAGLAALRPRRNLAHALMRLGWFARAKAVVQRDYEFMATRQLPNEMLYRSIQLGEIALYEGNLEEARLWIDITGRGAALNDRCSRHVQAGYFSAAAELALRDNRLDDAEGFVRQGREVYPAIDTPRYAALDLSLRLRIQLLRDGRADAGILSQLTALYQRGANLGSQDTVVEALWFAKTVAGQTEAASALLRDYLMLRRREGAATDSMLRLTTRTDPVWEDSAFGELCLK